jgi:hypothetical protein
MSPKSPKMFGDESVFSLFRCVESAKSAESFVNADPCLETSVFSVNTRRQEPVSVFRIRQIGRMRDFAEIGWPVIEAVSVHVVEHGIRPAAMFQKPDDMRDGRTLASNVHAKLPIALFTDSERPDAPKKLSGSRIVPEFVPQPIQSCLIQLFDVVNAHMGTPCN